MTSIHTIIPYCSYDKSYIFDCINSAKQVTDHVWVSYSDHLLNGDQEDQSEISKLLSFYEKEPSVKFIKYSFNIRDDIRIKHNVSRNVLIDQAIQNGATHLLLLDADEVIDVVRFKEWKKHFDPAIPSYKFKNYWYFRSPLYRAKTLEHTTVVARSEIYKEMYPSAPERDFFIKYGYSLVDTVLGEPLIHHFSWAKSKDELLLKVKNWGHYNDRNWIDLIEQEFSHDFNGSDFVHGYSYDILAEKFTNK